jgi:DNA/RNA-binding domain of Phe-tRNA-synthetase-like protein
MAFNGRSRMNFIVTDGCIRLGLRAGAIVFRNVRVTASSPAQRAEMADALAAVQARFSSPSAIRADPYVTSFRAILQKVGANPKKDQPSVERLLSFAHKRGDLPAINNLVDAYNLVSVRSSCSLGAHDLDRISLPVALRLLDGSESFTPLGTDRPAPAIAGEYGYVDASNRLLCRLDVLQADFSKVTEATLNALLIVEGTVARPAQDLRKAFADVLELVTRYCGGTGEIISFPG